jgi:hypothetical protein
VLDVDGYADDVPVPLVRPAMVCTRCGIIGAHHTKQSTGFSQVTGRDWLPDIWQLRNHALTAAMGQPFAELTP